MAADDMIVGLDIGTSWITAAIAEYDDTGELEIIGVGTAASSGLRRGVADQHRGDAAQRGGCD